MTGIRFYLNLTLLKYEYHINLTLLKYEYHK